MATAKTPRKAAATAAQRKAPARRAAAKATALSTDQLDLAILRFLRAKPNAAVDLSPLAADLRVDPITIQLAVERLHRRRMVVAPFIEPARAGGAELTEVGLRWLIAQEGGKPKDKPLAFQSAKGPVRVQEEARRLPRADVYGVRRS